MFDSIAAERDEAFDSAADEHHERWAAMRADMAIEDAAAAWEAAEEAREEAEALAGMGYEDLFTEPCDLSAPEPF